jgi:hypothetical protein
MDAARVVEMMTDKELKRDLEWCKEQLKGKDRKAAEAAGKLLIALEWERRRRRSRGRQE